MLKLFHIFNSQPLILSVSDLNFRIQKSSAVCVPPKPGFPPKVDGRQPQGCHYGMAGRAEGMFWNGICLRVSGKRPMVAGLGEGVFGMQRFYNDQSLRNQMF